MSIAKKIFADSEEKNVKTVLVYANSNNKLFYDEEFTNEVPAEDCVNLFLKGVVAIKSGVYYAALKCTEEGVIEFGFVDNHNAIP